MLNGTRLKTLKTATRKTKFVSKIVQVKVMHTNGSKAVTTKCAEAFLSFTVCFPFNAFAPLDKLYDINIYVYFPMISAIHCTENAGFLWTNERNDVQRKI